MHSSILRRVCGSMGDVMHSRTMRAAPPSNTPSSERTHAPSLAPLHLLCIHPKIARARIPPPHASISPPSAVFEATPSGHTIDRFPFQCRRTFSYPTAYVNAFHSNCLLFSIHHRTPSTTTACLQVGLAHGADPLRLLSRKLQRPSHPNIQIALIILHLYHYSHPPSFHRIVFRLSSIHHLSACPPFCMSSLLSSLRSPWTLFLITFGSHFLFFGGLAVGWSCSVVGC